ncbi:MAG: hypothetical protein A3J51_01445 [Omnitrophica WOR_2 bacterium RIFCSPHIGHO2_02_FULL_45_21]|nr:MAG: hypothetical protein A3J51_01445 [Omnitrophica WOR_2 bacterium RIFCSPHIGHO2_02_FULL_45_21]
MILEINLLPEELRKKRRAFRPKLSVDSLRKILGPAIAGFVFIHLLIPVVTFSQKLSLGRAKKAFLDIQPQKEKLDEIRNQLKGFGNLDELFKRMRGQRSGIAPQLNIISDYLPQGIWLSGLSVSKSAWEIKGSCIFGTEGEMAQIGKFLQALKSDARLDKDFASLELVSVERRKLGTTELADFILGSKTKGKTSGGGKKINPAPSKSTDGKND